MIWQALCAFVLSLVGCGLLLRQARSGVRPAYGQDKPQRFHVGEVPRLGGVALFAAVAASWALGVWRSQHGGDAARLGLDVRVLWALAAMLPLVLAGVAEDLTHRVGVRWRLLAGFVSAALLVWLCNLAVPRLGIAWLEQWLGAGLPLVGWLLALLALAGLPHAFNIIDGYNGLAAVVAAVVALALSHVALQVGDRTLAAMLVAVAAASGGFLFWNWPRGLLFAGDSGAYVWGLTIALGALALVQRHAEVSPWFPVLLLIYPVWETLFSIYRKLARGVSPGVADALHFHQLIYRRVVRGVFDDNLARRMLKRNNRTSPWLWTFTALTVLPAVLFWRQSGVLMLFCLLSVTLYMLTYLMLVRFRQPWSKK